MRKCEGFCIPHKNLPYSRCFILAFAAISLHTANSPLYTGYGPLPPSPLFPQKFGVRSVYQDRQSRLTLACRGRAADRINIPKHNVRGKVFDSHFARHLRSRLPAPHDSELSLLAFV
jgi:hypothetical protein